MYVIIDRATPLFKYINIYAHPSFSALLLSALKTEGIAYLPAYIKRELQNAAKPLGPHDVFSAGYGVIQVIYI